MWRTWKARVEMGIVDPHGPALLERDESQPLAVAGHEMQPRGDRVEQLVVRRRRAFDHRARRHVHVRGVPFQV